MQELKPLPCPACGSTDVYVRGRCNAQVTCRNCGMEGPEFCGPNEIVAAWNALPRALPWTDEPPTVAGWYWVRISDARYLPKIVQITAKDIEMMSAEHALLKGNREWAGPILAPSFIDAVRAQRSALIAWQFQAAGAALAMQRLISAAQTMREAQAAYEQYGSNEDSVTEAEEVFDGLLAWMMVDNRTALNFVK